jgi:8-oxo-dGTP pyrophosphatase MutT (NUDIX family)
MNYWRILKKLLRMESTDHLADHFPISVKGVLFVDKKVVLLKNERNEWELPGGKLERGEDPVACCEREWREETRLPVRAVRLLDAWLYPVTPATQVLILTYGCQLAGQPPPGGVQISHEHKEGRLFGLDELPEANTPAGYLASVRAWAQASGLANPTDHQTPRPGARNDDDEKN